MVDLGTTETTLTVPVPRVTAPPSTASGRKRQSLEERLDKAMVSLFKTRLSLFSEGTGIPANQFAKYINDKTLLKMAETMRLDK